MSLLEFERHLSPLTVQEEGLKQFWEKGFILPKDLDTGLDFLKTINIKIPPLPCFTPG